MPTAGKTIWSVVLCTSWPRRLRRSYSVQIPAIFYWFNPLAWYAACRMRVEQERGGGDLVLNLGASPEDYV